MYDEAGILIALIVIALLVGLNDWINNMTKHRYYNPQGSPLSRHIAEATEPPKRKANFTSTLFAALATAAGLLFILAWLVF